MLSVITGTFSDPIHVLFRSKSSFLTFRNVILCGCSHGSFQIFTKHDGICDHWYCMHMSVHVLLNSSGFCLSFVEYFVFWSCIASSCSFLGGYSQGSYQIPTMFDVKKDMVLMITESFSGLCCDLL